VSENLPQLSLTGASAAGVPVGGGLPGAALRAERESRGLTVEAVAQATRFSGRQVETLERDDYDSLPGMTTVRGFVRSYAKYLQVDAVPFLVALDLVAPPTKSEVRPPENLGEARQKAGASRRVATYLMVVGIAALLILTVYGLVAQQVHQPTSPALNSPKNDQHSQTLSTNGPAASAESVANAGLSAERSVLAPVVGSVAAVAGVPVTGAASPTLPGAAEKTTSGAAGNPTAAAVVLPPAPAALSVAFDGLSWIEIRDATQKTVLSGEFPAGVTQKVEGKAPFQVWVGRASVVRIFFGGRSIDLQPFTRADVARLTVE